MQAALIQAFVAVALFAMVPAGASEISRAIDRIGCSISGDAACLVTSRNGDTEPQRLADGTAPTAAPALSFFGIPLDGNG